MNCNQIGIQPANDIEGNEEKQLFSFHDGTPRAPFIRKSDWTDIVTPQHFTFNNISILKIRKKIRNYVGNMCLEESNDSINCEGNKDGKRVMHLRTGNIRKDFCIPQAGIWNGTGSVEK